jgi:hypothetical protein
MTGIHDPDIWIEPEKAGAAVIAIQAQRLSRG